MTTSIIISLIMSLAPIYGVEPKVALAVAAVESAYNAKAVGGLGEIGLYQIMPDIFKKKGYTRKQMFDPVINITVGLSMIRDAKEHCIHKTDINYLVCYNYGLSNAKKIKHPAQFPYVRKVRIKMRSV